MMGMAEVVIDASVLGSITSITIAVLERRPQEEIELWGFWGTTIGFLAGLFLAICCPESS